MATVPRPLAGRLRSPRAPARAQGDTLTAVRLEASRPAGARAATDGTPLLAIRRLTRRFGQRAIVEALDLTVEVGDRVALCGPNGSGKTTILRCIAGTLSPTDGDISVKGFEAGSIAARHHVGASLSQDRSFYLRLSGRANLLFFARLRYRGERAAQEAVRAIEEELELGAIAAQQVNRCSSGMLQQLGFARALLGNPSLLILDEPTRSLDVEALERLWGAIDRRQACGVLIATHNQNDVERCGTRIDLSS